MANKKTGFAYYQADTDRYLDIKIKRLKSKYGCTGIAVFDYILAAVYRDKGYWVEWEEHLRFDVSDYFNLEETIVEEITRYCVDLRLFNESIFHRSRILTSSSIQVRFVEMSKTCRRNDYQILPVLNVENPENCIIPPSNPHILPSNEEIPPKNHDIPPSNVGSLPQYDRSLPHTNVTNVT